MNVERMTVIIKDIERFSRDLSELDIKGIQDLQDKSKFYASSMILFSIINRAIDLGEEIVSYKKLGFPGTYKEIFYLLQKNNIIDKDLYQSLLDLIHFRNLAAHEYHTFTREDVFKAFKKINAVKNFVNAIKESTRK